jgi:hypothetical protein
MGNEIQGVGKSGGQAVRQTGIEKENKIWSQTKPEQIKAISQMPISEIAKLVANIQQEKIKSEGTAFDKELGMKKDIEKKEAAIIEALSKKLDLGLDNFNFKIESTAGKITIGYSKSRYIDTQTGKIVGEEISYDEVTEGGKSGTRLKEIGETPQTITISPEGKAEKKEGPYKAH